MYFEKFNMSIDWEFNNTKETGLWFSLNLLPAFSVYWYDGKGTESHLSNTPYLIINISWLFLHIHIEPLFKSKTVSFDELGEKGE